MNSGRAPALFALAGVVIAVLLFFLLKDDTADEDTTVPTGTPAVQDDGAKADGTEKSDKPEKPEVPVIEVNGGKPVGGVQELEFKSGEEARFEVVADAPDELHLHGYHHEFELKPGQPVEVTFEAEIEGIFELESHSTGELLAEISVVP